MKVRKTKKCLKAEAKGNPYDQDSNQHHVFNDLKKFEGQKTVPVQDISDKGSFTVIHLKNYLQDLELDGLVTIQYDEAG